MAAAAAIALFFVALTSALGLARAPGPSLVLSPLAGSPARTPAHYPVIKPPVSTPAPALSPNASPPAPPMAPNLSPITDVGEEPAEAPTVPPPRSGAVMNRVNTVGSVAGAIFSVWLLL